MWNKFCYFNNSDLTKMRKELKKHIAFAVRKRRYYKIKLKQKKVSYEDEHIMKLEINKIAKQLKVWRADLLTITKILDSRHRSKYNGEHHFNSFLRQKFGKTRLELTVEEKREYDKFMQKKHRANEK